ncbi:MAG: hypothetical protein AAF645_05570 [Myxococcota bacterium]
MTRLVLFGCLFAFACGGEVNETYTGTLEEGDSVQAGDGSFQDPYAFRTREGFAIDIQMTSTDLDSYVLLVDPDGQKVAEDDNGGEESNALLQHTARQSGTYTVWANAHTGQSGAYTLTIQATAPTSGD